MTIPGQYEIVANLGMSYTRTFTFFNGTQQNGTPYSFSGKTVYVEVKDPRRNTIIKVYPTSIQDNVVTLDIASVDIEPGQYIYRMVVVSGGRKNTYVNDKFIVSV